MFNNHVVSVLLLVVMAGSVTASHAGEFANSFTLQGFTGILNTPTATIQKEGTMAAWFGRQKEQSGLYEHQNNYFFSVGMFSLLELGGRVSSGSGQTDNNDLSAQFKVSTAPFTPKKYPWLPSLAVGMQDLGGGAHFFKTTYLVASEEINRFRFSLGYGFGPDRMDGVFGGAEIRAFDWLYLLGEYDTNDTNAGIRLVSPDLFGYPVNFHSSFKSALNHNPGTINFAVGLQFSLGTDWKRPSASGRPPESMTGNETPVSSVDPRAPAGIALSPVKAGAEELPVKAGVEAAKRAVSDMPSDLPGDMPIKAGLDEISAGKVAASPTALLITLRDRLVADGFNHVKTGSDATGLLVIEYENTRYNQSEMDAMGVVLGMVVDTADAVKTFKMVRLVPKVQDIRMLQVAVPMTTLVQYYRDPRAYDAFRDVVVVAPFQTATDVSYTEPASFSSLPRTRLVLAPRLKTFVASDVGVFDYELSLDPTVYVDLWKGAFVTASWNIPLAWSSQFNDGGLFHNQWVGTEFDRLMVYQAFRPHKDVMVSVGGGMVEKGGYGDLGEAYWYSPKGDHRLGFQQGLSSNNDEDFTRTMYLGSYRYRYAPLDAALTVSGGQFWDNDTGIKAEITRFFGDTEFSAYYKYSRTTYDQNYQVGGVRLAFPLTPRKGMKPYPVQVKGTGEWSYAQETVIAKQGEINSLSVSIGNTPQSDYSVVKAYYDRDRLTPDYITTHLSRLRDAYMTYRSR